MVAATTGQPNQACTTAEYNSPYHHMDPQAKAKHHDVCLDASQAPVAVGHVHTLLEQVISEQIAQLSCRSWSLQPVDSHCRAVNPTRVYTTSRHASLRCVGGGACGHAAVFWKRASRTLSSWQVLLCIYAVIMSYPTCGRYIRSCRKTLSH